MTGSPRRGPRARGNFDRLTHGDGGVDGAMDGDVIGEVFLELFDGFEQPFGRVLDFT